MPRIILILVIGLLLLLSIVYFRRQQPARQKKIATTLLLFVVVAILAVLAVTGKLSWLAALLGSLLALIPKVFSVLLRFAPAIQPFLQRFLVNKFSNRSKGNSSSVYESAYLKATINYLTGDMDGVVLKGSYSGRQLSSMSKLEMEALLSECHADQESYSLLMSYLQRCQPDWGYRQDRSTKQSTATMNKKEASEILGIDEKASRQDVIKAHRRLIQKLHPDRGGSDYLAARINQAKDVLLG